MEMKKKEVTPKEDALHLERYLATRKRFSISNARASDMYMRIARDWIEVGERDDKYAPEHALFAYKNALKLASGSEKERVRKEINKLYAEYPGLEAREKEKARAKNGGLERRTIYAAASIVSLVGALLSVSLNLTGHVIRALSYQNISIAGTAFFVLGLIFAFLFARSKGE
ncbi:MAG TPA: hypothetical protein VMC80_02100 [Patescibacteria group bacterium]|nr:hypothetical protein [Patescibacteria group bacterium]